MPLDTKKIENQSRLLKQAADLHRKGDLAAGERLYSQILKIRPDHFDALHFLRVLRHQQGRYMGRFRRSVRR
jgi:hypothetical protein